MEPTGLGGEFEHRQTLTSTECSLPKLSTLRDSFPLLVGTCTVTFILARHSASERQQAVRGQI